jgi:hypothetical protein
VQWFDLPATPGRQDVDPLVAEVDRIVVHGTDADLAAVVLRLLRKGLLPTTVVGYVPAAGSAGSDLWGIPVGSFDLALDGTARPAPLIRDDSGGLLVASGVIAPITGHVYCDDERVLNGHALRLEVSPDPDATPLPEPTADPLSTTLDPATDGLRVTALRRGLLRKRRDSASGRAVQASFRAATVVLDGVEHPRTAEKWGWYRHTEDLALVRP